MLKTHVPHICKLNGVPCECLGCPNRIVAWAIDGVRHASMSTLEESKSNSNTTEQNQNDPNQEN
jgi:hypothetical protein